MKIVASIAILLIGLSCTQAEADEKPKVVQGTFHVPDEVLDHLGDSKNGTDRGGRIYFGKTAGNGQFPWIVLLFFQTSPGSGALCTGSLVSDKYVIAAAHCIPEASGGRTMSLEISLGSVDRENPEQRVYSDQFVWLTYGDGKYIDLAIFRLANSVRFTSNVQPLALPPRSYTDRSFTNDLVTVAGFGGTPSGSPRYLQYTQLMVLSTDECLKYFSGIDFNTICGIGYPDKRQSVCFGDSGTSIVYYEYGRPMMLGVSSFFWGCEAASAQGFVRVSKYLDFISSVTGIPIR